ncbi:type 1 glutamine amidotransferase domain-containing protein [Thalassobacillus pellis]|uniref:type 1 glutamine amidotransferase domain-containing protein n=1 Tax=Thalassobacillus pellis TaxID=748008 RepID=UPI001960BBC1|nr:type 1 glutamine amidotransferase domain-containing protein [Thalassobacillus pellis]MBM7551843.1 putative intracellular protease/amidase [Thalassobacillus pellis]
MAKKVLMIVTNTSRIDNDHETGLWLSEFVEPYMEFTQEGFEVTTASPKGGKVHIDPNSFSNELPKEWDGVMDPLDSTVKLEDINPEEFDGVFLPGGHGTMFDFPENETMQTVLKHFVDKGKLVGAVCHGPAGFVGVKDKNGDPIVKGRKITGFTDAEEKDTELDSLMPFLLESRLREEGAEFVAADNYEHHIEVDGNFITGQNPQSSLDAGRAFADAMKK